MRAQRTTAPSELVTTTGFPALMIAKRLGRIVSKWLRERDKMVSSPKMKGVAIIPRSVGLNLGTVPETHRMAGVSRDADANVRATRFQRVAAQVARQAGEEPNESEAQRLMRIAEILGKAR